MDHHLQHFASLFSSDEKAVIHDAPMFHGRRHPTWRPLFGEQSSLRVAEYRLNQSVALMANLPAAREWLRSKTHNLLDCEDITNASAAMAEIRAYGGLLDAGFDVEPIRVAGKPTPEFLAKHNEHTLVVEVASKHQGDAQNELDEQIHNAIHNDGPLPEGVEHHRFQGANTNIETFISVHHPGGAPDPDDPNDSVQTNVISKVCSIKQSEKQIEGDLAALLIADFSAFEEPGFEGLLKHASPIIRGHNGFTSGALWYAMYGWTNAPVFEELNELLPRMQHEGRFSQLRQPKSKLSGVLFVLPEAAVLLENPAPVHRLDPETRLALCTYPWFDIAHSVLDWEPGTAQCVIDLQRKMIDRFDASFESLRFP